MIKTLVPAKIKQFTSLATFKEKRHETMGIAFVVYAKRTNFIT